MNLPNKLTILRVILIPFFVFFILTDFVPASNYIALAIFIIASLTDMLDGKIARKYNLVTNFGKFMDPIADKLLVIIALMCLLVIDGGARMYPNQVLALISVIIIVARELIINGFRLVASDNGVVIAAGKGGKIKTASTMVAICLMIVDLDLTFLKIPAMVLYSFAVVVTVVSLIDYLAKNKDVLKDKGNK